MHSWKKMVFSKCRGSLSTQPSMNIKKYTSQEERYEKYVHADIMFMDTGAYVYLFLIFLHDHDIHFKLQSGLQLHQIFQLSKTRVNHLSCHLVTLCSILYIFLCSHFIRLPNSIRPLLSCLSIFPLSQRTFCQHYIFVEILLVMMLCREELRVTGYKQK